MQNAMENVNEQYLERYRISLISHLLTEAVPLTAERGPEFPDIHEVEVIIGINEATAQKEERAKKDKAPLSPPKDGQGVEKEHPVDMQEAQTSEGPREQGEQQKEQNRTNEEIQQEAPREEGEQLPDLASDEIKQDEANEERLEDASTDKGSQPTTTVGDDKKEDHLEEQTTTTSQSGEKEFEPEKKVRLTFKANDFSQWLFIDDVHFA